MITLILFGTGMFGGFCLGCVVVYMLMEDRV
jgi:hypothetical protein